MDGLDPIKLMGAGVGLVLILATAVLAWRDKLGMPHVVAFAIGAVLAGIPYVHIAGPDGSSVDIGDVRQAAADNTAAAASQAMAIGQINARIDKLSGTVATLSDALEKASAQSPAAAQNVAPAAASVRSDLSAIQESGKIAAQSLQQSRTYSLSAAQRLKLNLAPAQAGGSP